MSQIMTVRPKLEGPQVQIQQEPRDERRREELEKIALLKCECLSCRGGIEFESSKFQERIRTNLMVFGQNITCPHCGRMTSIYKDLRPAARFIGHAL